MEEVSGFLGGDWDYINLKGGTGPLVYPAGFVYLFSVLYYLTDLGNNILLGQYLFLGLYVAFIAVLFVIHHKAKVVSHIKSINTSCASSCSTPFARLTLRNIL